MQMKLMTCVLCLTGAAVETVEVMVFVTQHNGVADGGSLWQDN